MIQLQYKNSITNYEKSTYISTKYDALRGNFFTPIQNNVFTLEADYD